MKRNLSNITTSESGGSSNDSVENITAQTESIIAAATTHIGNQGRYYL